MIHQYSVHYKILTGLVTLLILPFATTASASVIGPPECRAEIDIQIQNEENLIGVLTNARHTALTKNPFCQSLNGIQVRLTGFGVYDKNMLARGQHFVVGVFRGSSMGENGPVGFEHWTLLSMQDGDTKVPQNILPAINLERMDMPGLGP